MKYLRHYEMVMNRQKLDDDSEGLIDFYSKQNLLNFVIFNSFNSSQFIEHKEFIMIKRLQFQKKLAEIQKICNVLMNSNIDYRVLKGVSIALKYPEPYTRTMGDFDILIKPTEHDRAVSLLLGLGYKKGPETDHDICLLKEGCLKIELHYSLLNEEREPYSKELIEFVWENFVLLDTGFGEIRIPSHYWHYRYIILHMMKHLKYKGFGLRYLLDVVYYVDGYNIEVLEHISYFESIGYGWFYKAILFICNKHFGLKLEAEWKSEIDLKCIEWLEVYIAESGTYGGVNPERKVMDLHESFLGKADWSKSNMFLTLFPTREILCQHYKYAKKSIFLLPLAWTHRLIRCILRKDLMTDEKLFMIKKNKKVLREKDKMMKYLGLWK